MADRWLPPPFLRIQSVNSRDICSAGEDEKTAPNTPPDKKRTMSCLSKKFFCRARHQPTSRPSHSHPTPRPSRTHVQNSPKHPRTMSWFFGNSGGSDSSRDTMSQEAGAHYYRPPAAGTLQRPGQRPEKLYPKGKATNPSKPSTGTVKIGDDEYESFEPWTRFPDPDPEPDPEDDP